jgi:hypothetical protein
VRRSRQPDVRLDVTARGRRSPRVVAAVDMIERKDEIVLRADLA